MGFGILIHVFAVILHIEKLFIKGDCLLLMIKPIMAHEVIGELVDFVELFASFFRECFEFPRALSLACLGVASSRIHRLHY